MVGNKNGVNSIYGTKKISFSNQNKNTSLQTQLIPFWAQSIIVGVFTLSSLVVIYVTPYFLVNKDNRFSPPLVVPQYITAGVPFFLLLIFTESCLLSYLKVRSVAAHYGFVDTLVSLSSGIVDQLWIAMINGPLGIGILPYAYIYEHYAFFRNPSPSAVAIVLCILSIDIGYYWFHRVSHENAILWSGHSVHHSSDHYNYSTALRQSWFQALTGWAVYLPLAVFFHPLVYITYKELNLWYQFWVHTCLVRRLGFLEYIFMTPSHHRVHHDRRVHKNFGGLFIFWDQLFGTFLDETTIAFNDNSEKLDVRNGQTSKSDPKLQRLGVSDDGEELCLFGTHEIPPTWTEGALQYWFIQKLINSFNKSKEWNHKWKRLMHGPGYTTASMKRSLVTLSTSTRLRLHELSLTGIQKLYLLLHFGVVVVQFLAILVLKLPYFQGLVLTISVLTTLAIQGFIFDRNVYAWKMETIRCASTAVLSAVFLSISSQPLQIINGVVGFTHLFSVIANYFGIVNKSKSGLSFQEQVR